jgi:hypothetical protein
MTRIASLLLVLLLAACASKPKAPEWQVEAHGSLERYVNAFMAADTRVEAAEFVRAREQLTRTGDAGLVARAELTRCGLRVASLVFEPCVGFDALRPDAPAAERAYADYLAGKALPRDAALLPPAHQAVAAASADGAAVQAIADPLARLVAAGVMFETGRASPDVLQLAVDTASAHGWRKPLLARRTGRGAGAGATVAAPDGAGAGRAIAVLRGRQ